MTAAVAGRAAAAATGGGRAAAGGAAARSSRPLTKAGNKPKPNIDEREAAAAERTQARGDRAAGEFRKRYQMDGGKRAEKKEPKEPKPEKEPAATQPTVVNIPGPVSSGAGFILAVLFWSWIALPFLKNGPEGVSNMLRAKFTNKAPDGSWLP